MLARFSALQRAEIAEIHNSRPGMLRKRGFSALQRAEIAEMHIAQTCGEATLRFSALQRAEIAEMKKLPLECAAKQQVSVLFNEPKLLKYLSLMSYSRCFRSVSVLFNEPKLLKSLLKSGGWLVRDVSVLFNEPKLLKSLQLFDVRRADAVFQCSSTSRNC